MIKISEHDGSITVQTHEGCNIPCITEATISMTATGGYVTLRIPLECVAMDIKRHSTAVVAQGAVKSLEG